MTDPASLDILASELDRVDVLVNNAGVHYDTWQTPLTADPAIVREAFEVNALGAWNAIR